MAWQHGICVRPRSGKICARRAADVDSNVRFQGLRALAGWAAGGRTRGCEPVGGELAGGSTVRTVHECKRDRCMCLRARARCRARCRGCLCGARRRANEQAPPPNNHAERQLVTRSGSGVQACGRCMRAASA